MDSNLYFWRDNTGNEIDLLVEKADTLVPIEIKSGQTVTKDYFTGIEKWLKICDAVTKSPCVIYGGNESQRRLGIEVVPWWDIVKLTEHQ